MGNVEYERAMVLPGDDYHKDTRYHPSRQSKQMSRQDLAVFSIKNTKISNEFLMVLLYPFFSGSIDSQKRTE